MAHNVETMAYAGELPWHKLGARVSDDVSVDEMLVAAGLDWNVGLRPLRADVGDGKTVPVPGRFALVRDSDNRVLTITGKTWKPVQNAEILNFMRSYVEAGGATLETAGSLRGGKIVWGLAKINYSFSVRRNDTVNGYLLLTSYHEAGRATVGRTTTVRVVCQNTMDAADAEGTIQYRQNHLTQFNPEAAKDAFGKAVEELAAAEARYKTIAKLKLNIEDAIKKVIVPSMMPEVMDDSEVMENILLPESQPKKLAEIINSLNNAPGAVPGTGWGVLNAITHWSDHVAGRNESTRMYRSIAGDIGRSKKMAERKLLELAA